MEEKEDKNKDTQAKEETTEENKPKSKKKLIIIIVAVLVLLAGGGGGYFFLMKKKSPPPSHKEGEETVVEEKEKEKKVKNEEVFLNLEDFIVNLQEGDRQPSFLKMEITLQIPNQQTLTLIQAKMPIIQDSFQTYLRELRADDLQGSAGIYRLREELLLRINKITFPEKVTDILFREFLVQ